MRVGILPRKKCETPRLAYNEAPQFAPLVKRCSAMHRAQHLTAQAVEFIEEPLFCWEGWGGCAIRAVGKTSPSPQSRNLAVLAVLCRGGGFSRFGRCSWRPLHAALVGKGQCCRRLGGSLTTPIVFEVVSGMRCSLWGQRWESANNHSLVGRTAQS